MKCKVISYDDDSKEANIQFNDCNTSLITYCPFLRDVLLNKSYELIAFLPKNIVRTNQNENIVKTNNGFYSYKLVGKLIEINNDYGKVLVNGLTISIEDVPLDIEINENVSFDVTRIDYCEIE